ncbi:MAG: hypothetical protein V1816_18840 [Pseudomonadota bacterium]
MTVARSEIVTEGAEGIYHCVSRCVHRAFLCGKDSYTGKSLEHRKFWVQARLELLARTFALEIFAFAVMSNHLHVVLRARPDLAGSWSDEKTAARWLMVFPKRKTESGQPAEPSPGEIRSLADDIELIRGRLASVSWFMRSLNEHIARRANREDGCKKRFWEGRFRCQAVLDKAALLTCMTCVDLNPVRAGETFSPETSLHASAFLRIRARRDNEKLAPTEVEGQPDLPIEEQERRDNEKTWSRADQWLCPFQKEPEAPRSGLLDITLDRYLEVLDWTGRQFRKGGKKSVPEELTPIL